MIVGHIGTDRPLSGYMSWDRYRDGMDTWNGTPGPDTNPSLAEAAGYVSGSGGWQYQGAQACALKFTYYGYPGTPYFEVKGIAYPNRDKALQAMAACQAAEGVPPPSEKKSGKKGCCCGDDQGTGGSSGRSGGGKGFTYSVTGTGSSGSSFWGGVADGASFIAGAGFGPLIGR